MSRDQHLSSVLSEFARTLLSDFPIQGILDHLVERIVEVLPISSAGVTLIAPGVHPRYIAASNSSALEYEQLQTSLGEGPCVSAYQTGVPVSITDMQADENFPRFREAALSAGLGAVFTFPLRKDGGRLGALDLYRDSPGGMDDWEMASAQTLADVAAAYLFNAEGRQESREAADTFRESSLHDALTGLPNRVLLNQRLEHAALRALRTRSEAAVLYADLDDFKHVNDAYGHATGDALLVAVAQRLTLLLRSSDTLARVSGDEFVILCEDLKAPSDVEILAERIDRAFTKPFVLTVGRADPVEVSITASVGMAFAGQAKDIQHRLVLDADVAMYQAKRKGGAAHQLIDLLEADRTADRTQLRQDLGRALKRDELRLAFQPIVQAADGVVIGAESLLRWTHPVRGPVAASAMIAAAEQTGLIKEIGRWVLLSSCQQRMAWVRDKPATPLGISVNVSARDLMGAGFSETVAEVLEETAMDPAALTLEMTESIFLDDGPRAHSVLWELRRLGVQLALDDFGAGFCSLSYLRRLPVDVVKIDHVFIADVGLDPAGRTILAAITNLAHALGIRVTAERIETAGQRDEIVAMGCDSAQGHYIGRPQPADALSALFLAQPTGPLKLPIGI